MILDITKAEGQKLAMIYNADRCINDAHDVKLGITYNSQFAAVADGRTDFGWSVDLPDTRETMASARGRRPSWWRRFKIPFNGHALAISKGLDRDRAVDEVEIKIRVFRRVELGR